MVNTSSSLIAQLSRKPSLQAVDCCFRNVVNSTRCSANPGFGPLACRVLLPLLNARSSTSTSYIPTSIDFKSIRHASDTQNQFETSRFIACFPHIVPRSSNPQRSCRASWLSLQVHISPDITAPQLPLHSGNVTQYHLLLVPSSPAFPPSTQSQSSIPRPTDSTTHLHL